MPDLNITASGVLVANSNTVIGSGYSAGAISAGQVLYLNTSNPSQLSPAIATSQVQSQAVIGVALDSALGANQLVTYATAGTVVLPTTGTGTTLTNGAVYVLSAGTAGNMIAATDSNAPGAGSLITPIGMAMNPTMLLVNLTSLGAFR